MLGWLSNVFLVVALIRMGKHHRDGFVWGAIGEALWLVEAIRIDEKSLAAMCVLLFSIYIINIIRSKDA